ncbi:MAG: hypothetical protein AAF518_24250, partial [Spirochaetota bacterium]
MKFLLFNRWMLIVLVCLVLPLWAEDDWQDLYEGEKKIRGRERLHKFKQDSFYFQLEDWEGHHSWKVLRVLGQKDYPRYRSSQFLPFYYHLKSKLDEREKSRVLNYYRRESKDSIIVHVYPLYYKKKDKLDGSSYSGVFPFYFRDSKDGNSRLFTPLSYHSTTAAGTRDFIFPFYYKQSDSNSSYSHVLPFYFQKKDSSGELSHFLGYTKSQSADGTYHKNFLGITDWYGSRSKGLAKLQVHPFFYYEPGKSVSFLPFYFSDKESGVASIPLLGYYKHDKAGEKQLLAGGIYYQSESKKNSEKSRHIFPISFRWQNKESAIRLEGLSFYENKQINGEYHRNFLGLLDWYGHKNRGVEQLNFYPLAYHRKEYYTYILPFYFYDKQDGYETIPLLAYVKYNKQDEEIALYGPYYTSENKKTGETSKHILPLAFRWQDKKSKTKFLGLSYYHKETREGYYHRNFLGLLDWYGHKNRGLEKLNFYPLAYYKKDLYTHIIPFYFYDKEEGYETIPLLAYMDYEKNGKKVFLAGTYYKSENKYTGEKSKHLFPVSMQWEDRKGKTKFLGLSYYQHMTKEGYYHRNLLGLLDWYGHKHRGLNKLNVYPLAYYKKDFYTHIIPFYFYDKNDGYKTVPLLAYLDYEKNGKKVFLAGTYYKSENKHTGEKSKHLFPVSMQWEDRKGKTKFLGLSYYQHMTKEGYYHRNLLGLLDWYGHKHRGLNKLNVYP